MEGEELMTTGEVMARLNLSYSSVRRLIRLALETDGVEGLEASDVGLGRCPQYRVSEEQLQRFLLKRAVRPGRKFRSNRRGRLLRGVGAD